MNSPFWIYLIGLCAQALFTGRVLIQWYVSEKSGRSESPSLFWILSIAASMLMCVYGWLRKDATIILGECLAYYVYMWNIKVKGLYGRLPFAVPLVQALLPPFVIALLWHELPCDVSGCFGGGAMPLPLFVLGLTGQIVFKSRFIFQFAYSIRHGESSMPLVFWVIAVCGSALIILYALIRHDWVLLLGQCGIAASIRNIMLIIRSR